MSDDNPDQSGQSSRTQPRRSGVTSTVEVSPGVVFGLLGASDVNLRTLEQLLPADIHVRGNQVTLTGEPAEVAASERVIAELVDLVNTEDMRFISVRIGSFTGKSEVDSLRLCSTLLTPRDAVQLFGLAVEYEGPKKFFITYGASDNIDGDFRGFLDISAGIEELGYKPQDHIAAERHRFIS